MWCPSLGNSLKRTESLERVQFGCVSWLCFSQAVSHRASEFASLSFCFVAYKMGIITSPLDGIALSVNEPGRQDIWFNSF